jgi:nucleoside-diphosphate-sugar epimerase
MKIAILGATSYIAKDLICSFFKNSCHELSLFSRNSNIVKKWLNKNSIKKEYKVDEYKYFNVQKEFDVIINFVGIGDPEKAAIMGEMILDITYQYDDMALNYLKEHLECKYIFISSGAVYNSKFDKPADENTESIVPINNLKSNNWYGIAKMYAECRHRSLAHLSIVDLRVFNYFSHTLDIESRFFIADVMRAIKYKSVLTTTADNIVRDYIGPDDFYSLILLIMKVQKMNAAMDCYTKEPVDKINLLNNMNKIFGLKYVMNSLVNGVNATGRKSKYYSKRQIENKIGFTPTLGSLETVIKEMKKSLCA